MISDLWKAGACQHSDIPSSVTRRKRNEKVEREQILTLRDLRHDNTHSRRILNMRKIKCLKHVNAIWKWRRTSTQQQQQQGYQQHPSPGGTRSQDTGDDLRPGTPAVTSSHSHYEMTEASEHKEPPRKAIRQSAWWLGAGGRKGVSASSSSSFPFPECS